MPVTPVASSPGRSCETRVGSCRSSNGGSSEPSRSPDSPGLWSARSLGSAAIVDSARTTSIGCKHRRLCSTLPPSVLCSIAWHRHETFQTPSKRELEYFFQLYKDLEGRTMQTRGWGDRDEARRIIGESRTRHLESRGADEFPVRLIEDK